MATDDHPASMTFNGDEYVLVSPRFATKAEAGTFFLERMKKVPKGEHKMFKSTRGTFAIYELKGVYVEPLKVHKGPVPMGYSFVGIFDTREKVDRWYAAAIKAKDAKPYLLTNKGGLYQLWTFKRKGGGKMIGKGWGEKPEPIGSKRRKY